MGRPQQCNLRQGRTWFIETPEGIIQFKHLKRHTVLFDLPGGMRAFDRIERVLEHARFVREKEPDLYVPTYGILIPQVNQEGALVGVDTKELNAVSPENGENNDKVTRKVRTVTWPTAAQELARP